MFSPFELLHPLIFIPEQPEAGLENKGAGAVVKSHAFRLFGGKPSGSMSPLPHLEKGDHNYRVFKVK